MKYQTLLHFKFYILHFTFLSLYQLGISQPIDTTLQFQTIEITAPRLNAFRIGTKKTAFTNFQKITTTTQDLGTALSLNTPIFIKNYGPGRLATTSIRGASAAQTVVLWNGFNLNNSMLGQSDFSLIPAFFMDGIAVQYGSNSTAWGSGAVGGTIILENKATFQKGWTAHWNSSIGSFDNYFNGLSVGFSNERITSTTKAFYQTGENDFPIKNGRSDKLPHSQVKKWGILQKNGFKIKDNQQLDLNLWYQTADRNLPPNLVQTTSDARQEDESFRSSLNWKYIQSNAILQIRSGLFYERLFYQDPVDLIDSRSRTWTYRNEVEWTKSFSTTHSLNLGGNYAHLTAKSPGNYEGTPQQNRTALFAMYQWKPSNQKWQTQLSIRQEWVDDKATPFIPALGIEGQLSNHFSISGNISRSYRVPTFNDLFWQNLGQKDLLSEDGWNQEIGLNYTFNSQWKFSTTAYNRNVDNWIIWQPNSGIWTPQNLQKVWSRGLENTLNWQQQFKDLNLQFSLNYDLTFSTNQQSISARDNTKGKQLIYVPKHKLNATLQAEWKDWTLAYYHLYTSKVYTLFDNSDALPSYHLDHLYLYKKFGKQQLKGTAFVKFNNLFGVNYQVVAQYAMPKQNFEIGWQIGF